ncbi:hypothetical protein HW555_007047 [Spodoptera exigua]|uniref:Multidrug resistance-associated protein lethal(2)03659 n=1 Tax=Spodoptera exigua TaxID=7107 RepID=A0A835L5S9_SPOEX|nr:hypothetical protein HW555_007047 [Spodoptera exigua]
MHGPKQNRTMNPRYGANWFSILTFGYVLTSFICVCTHTTLSLRWTLETFKMGYSRDIKETDLYAPLPEHRSSVLGDAVQKAWDREVLSVERRGGRRKPSLWRVLFKVFGCELMFYGLILAAMEFLIRLQQPIFLALLLRYYSPIHGDNNPSNTTYLNRFFSYDTEGSVTWGEAVFFAFGIIFCSAFNIMVQHPFMMGVMHMGMKMRVGVCSLIYRKALKVNIQAMTENSGGLVLNLMANDVNRFDTGPLFAHYLWIGPFETMLMTVYLYREMGMPAVYGSLIIIAVIPFQIFLGTNTAYFRRGTAVKSDERVRLMKEIILGMEVIKMYTWEQPFRKIIDIVRRQEIFYIKMTSYIRGVIMSFIMFTSRFGIFITVLLYVTYVKNITVENVFFLTCYYNITKQTMTLYFPQAVGQIAEMNVAIQRIRDYLLTEECSLPERLLTNVQHVPPVRKKRVVIIEPRKEEIAIKFENASSRWIKSADKDDVNNLDLTIFKGSLTTVIGAVGSGKSTLLHIVLSELPCTNGTVQINGTISYASQDPWLFVGSVRQNILFGQAFQKSRYMEVCRVCALEKDISLFPHGDKTVVGERGVSLSGGQRARINLARAVYKEADIYLLDDPLSAVDTQVAKHIFERCIKKYLANKTVVLVTHQLQFIKAVDHVVIMDKGNIIGNGAFEDLEEKELKIIQLMKENIREIREEDSMPNDLSTLMQPSAMSMLRRHWSMILDTSVADQKPEAESQASGRVHGSVYREYFMAGAPCCFVIIVCLLFILAQFCASACDYWISRSNAEDKLSGDNTMDVLVWAEQGLVRRDFVVIFGVITITTIAVALTRAFFFFSLCMKSSIKLHDQMFESISKSPMSFFHSNPSGRILNRFSKDMGAVDELLPQAMIDCFQIILNLMGVVLVILMTDITLMFPIAAAIVVFYIFRVIYIRTTGAVKRLEGITRSPVFGHVNATILGLATIRSFGAEFLLAEEFDLHQDLHSAAWYLFITCSRAFGFFLDLICLLFIVCVTFSCLMKTDMDGSYVGLAITQAISLTGIFQWGMRQSAEMENQMTSVERVLEYTKLPQEPALRTPPEKTPPADWPAEGAIIFNTLSLKYAQDGNYEPVLFSGTIRKNLDPFDEYPDSVLITALNNVELQEEGGESLLYKQVAEGGSNFSVGQRQLVCLARAIVHNNRILVLDEATANVDAETDLLIQTAIRLHFNNCTVLTIAHRLNTIIDSDKILVLDAGRLMEFDHPHVLLQNKKGYFRKMVSETGPSMASHLHKLAAQSYTNEQSRDKMKETAD